MDAKEKGKSFAKRRERALPKRRARASRKELRELSKKYEELNPLGKVTGQGGTRSDCKGASQSNDKDASSIRDGAGFNGYDKSEAVLTICKLVCLLSEIFK